MSQLKPFIPSVADWPVPGVMYRDITGITTNTDGFRLSCNLIIDHLNDKVDCIAAVDARGFVWGGVAAYTLRKPLHLIRKPGKLPPPTRGLEYDYEYAKASLHIKADANITAMSRVGIIDDVNATGGTALAIIELLKGFNVAASNIHYCCIIDLPYLGGSQKIQDLGVNFFAATTYSE